MHQLYLVRWPDETIAIISARDAVDLFERLDQQADPYACTWEEYSGPVWFEFPPLRDAAPPGEKVDPMTLFQGTARIPDSDIRWNKMENVLSVASPAAWDLIDGSEADDHVLTAQEAHAALDADRGVKLEHDFHGYLPEWAEHARWSPELMKAMDLRPPWVKGSPELRAVEDDG